MKVGMLRHQNLNAYSANGPPRIPFESWQSKLMDGCSSVVSILTALSLGRPTARLRAAYSAMASTQSKNFPEGRHDANTREKWKERRIQ